MEHFSVIQSLCRTGLETRDDRFRRQVERLRDRLRESGDVKAAGTIERLLKAATSEATLAPSVIEVSRSLVTGDELTANVHAPADRETGVPLAEVVLNPAAGRPTPIYDVDIEKALGGILDEWLKTEHLKAIGIEPSRSCLIYGPPGTGKTLTAFTLAARLGLPVVNARIDGLVSSFLGTTARNIANLFEFANRYRCVLVLDEFDALAKMRDDPHELGEIKRVVNTLLQNLDSRAGKGLTIAITNHEALLDPAVWRRFENHIRMTLPDAFTRVAMLKTFLVPLTLDDDVVKTLAFVAGERSGSDLKNFADSLKRNLALGNSGASPPEVMTAARTLLMRLGFASDGIGAARLFLDDEPGFVGSVLNSEFTIKQESLAQMLVKSQSTVSRYAKDFQTRRSTGGQVSHAE